jgi:REP element-mobilizing transposase RayT
MPTKKILTPLEPDFCYHIYNRGNNKEPLFYTESNYNYFIERYYYYLKDQVHTYAYCLLPNHFHILIRVRSQEVSSYFQRFFQSYAVSINKQENRSGSLFRKTYRRIRIEDNVYLKWLVYYIHYNPEKHKISRNYRKYSFSSYQSFLTGPDKLINQDHVFEWFGDKMDFIDYHNYHYERRSFEKDKFEG